MKIRVQFFSQLRELAGISIQEVDVAEGTSLGGLVDQVYAEFPALRGWNHSLLLAVGVEFATRERILQEKDLVSLMPPVGGG